MSSQSLESGEKLVDRNEDDSKEKPMIRNSFSYNSYLRGPLKTNRPTVTYRLTENDMKDENYAIAMCFLKQGNLPDEKIYECKFCNRVFENKSAHVLLSHIRVAHPYPVYEPKERVSGLPASFPFTIYFTRVGEEWQCNICNALLIFSSQCQVHMTTWHENILKKYGKTKSGEPVRKVRKTSDTKDILKNASIDSTKGTVVNYDDKDPENFHCDYFRRVADTMQCTICHLLIKTTNITHLIKHLRLYHAMHTAQTPAQKRRELNPTDGEMKTAVILPRTVYSTYDNPSLNEEDDDYFWNFFENRDGNSTCICCGITLTRITHHSLLKHLQLIHPYKFSPAPDSEVVLNLSQNPKQNPIFTLRRKKSSKSERLITSFMLSQGIPPEGVNDPHFEYIQHSVNRLASIQSVDSFGKVVDEMNVNLKKTFTVDVKSPVTASIDFHIEGEEDVYVALALHHFESGSQRQNNVFLKKLAETSITYESVIRNIQGIMKQYGYNKNNLCSIVMNQKHEALFDEIFRNSGVKGYHCFYTCLSDFAESVLKLPEIENAIDKLFKFLKSIRNNPILVARFELLLKGCDDKFDIFQSKANLTWTQMMEFVRKTVEDLNNFVLLSTFARRWSIDGWLEPEDTKILLFLCQILDKVAAYAKLASSPDGVTSLVIPIIKDLMTFLKITIKDHALIYNLSILHDQHFSRFREGTCNGKYDFSLFLDPRYSWNLTIYDSKKWMNIKQKVKEMLIRETDTDPIDYLNDGDDGDDGDDQGIDEIPSMIQLNRNIPDEVTKYINEIKNQRPNFENAKIMDWWEEHKKAFPVMYLKALEFFTVPMCTMSAESLFGNNGKLARFKFGLGYHQQRSILDVVSRTEVFRGRGYEMKLAQNHENNLGEAASESILDPGISEEVRDSEESTAPPPMPPRLANLACAQPPKPRKTMVRNRLFSPSRFIEEKERDPFLERMLMSQPPPVLEPMVETIETMNAYQGFDCKMEDTHVKQEVMDPDVDSWINISKSTGIVTKLEEPFEY